MSHVGLQASQERSLSRVTYLSGDVRRPQKPSKIETTEKCEAFFNTISVKIGAKTDSPAHGNIDKINVNKEIFANRESLGTSLGLVFRRHVGCRPPCKFA